jgi:hypothetical protein
MFTFDRILKNKDGKVVLWQNPNLPLWGWVIFSVLGVVFKHGNLHSGFQYLGKASLFTWAYLEIRSGESMFRRALGLLIMAGILIGTFKA